MSKESLSRFWLGKPLDPFDHNTRKHIALITFFAWIGLGRGWFLAVHCG